MQGPLVPADGAVEVIVVPLTTLLSVSMGDPVLSLQQPRNLCPLLDAPLFVELLERAIFLGRERVT